MTTHEQARRAGRKIAYDLRAALEQIEHVPANLQTQVRQDK